MTLTVQDLRGSAKQRNRERTMRVVSSWPPPSRRSSSAC